MLNPIQPSCVALSMASNAVQFSLTFPEPVDPAVVRSLKTLIDAVNLCISVTGASPKDAYLDLGIDKGWWSKIQSGQNPFPSDKLVPLMEKYGNDIPLTWLAFQRNKGTHLLESEQQRLLRQKDEENRALQLRIDVLMDIVRGKVPV